MYDEVVDDEEEARGPAQLMSEGGWSGGEERRGEERRGELWCCGGWTLFKLPYDRWSSLNFADEALRGVECTVPT